MKLRLFSIVTLILTYSLSLSASADDWSRFRGPNGSGVASDAMALPATWGETENVKWKLTLPGPGSSCPIVVGDKVFVTCWSGYGIDREYPGNQEDLKRHLVCIDRETGKTIWDKSTKAVLPEDKFGGMFAEHGYATHTPVSDGENIYAFFGKSGIFAFDMDGNQIWHNDVGDGLDPKRWGSSCSPILYQDIVIVNAAAESRSIIAFNKKTGEEEWRHESEGLNGTWSTPLLVDVNGGQELVTNTPTELLGIDPASGKINWTFKMPPSNAVCSSLVAADGVVFALGSRNGGSVAVKCGGKGDVSESHVAWRGNSRGGIGTPVIHGDHLYWVSRGIANCVDIKTGSEVYKERLEQSSASESAQPTAGSDKPAESGQSAGRGQQPSGRRRGGPPRSDYASMIAGDGKLIFMTRAGEGYVIQLGPEFKQLATNKMEDGGDFSSTPAISKNQLFIRSSKTLYCIGE